MKRTFGYLLAGVIGGATVLFSYDQIIERPTVTVEAQQPTVKYVNMPIGSGTTSSTLDFTNAAEGTVNSVVHVTTEASVNGGDPFMDYFMGRSAPRTQRGAGSGVIITEDGYIVTNNHVVQGADIIQIHLNDQRSYTAEVIGVDPSTDLALLKINEGRLPHIEMGNSDEVRVGEWVLAVGNPLNLTSTVTAGIVSAKARNINLLQNDPSRDIFPVESFIQTDAAVNPGNSGGALVNTNGELVGINTAIASMTGSYAGYSFAVPVNIVRKVTNDLLEYGSVQRAYIGVSIRNMDQEIAEKLGLNAGKGVYVNGLTEGGAAADAGVEPGDVIMKVGAMEVNNVPQLQEQVSKFRPGDKVSVTVFRDGADRQLDMRLRDMKGRAEISENNVTTDRSVLFGAELTIAPQNELKALGLNHGVKVHGIHSGKLRSSGIREGFIITKVDGTSIRSPEDLEKIVGNKNGGVLVEGLYPNGMKAYYGLGI